MVNSAVWSNLTSGWRGLVRMFDASPHVDLIGRSHSRGSGIPPALLDIVEAFALFHRSAIDLLLSGNYFQPLILTFKAVRSHTILLYSLL